jgi:hypothetical protein
LPCYHTAKETVIIELTPEQHEALTQNGSQPMQAIDRVTRIEYVLVRADLYEWLKELLSEADRR